jgi:hypothetical protein
MKILQAYFRENDENHHHSCLQLDWTRYSRYLWCQQFIIIFNIIIYKFFVRILLLVKSRGKLGITGHVNLKWP